MIKLLQEGTWSVSSENDPRWNGSGRQDVGGFVMPSGVKEYIEKQKLKYGEPPFDLTWSYMKD